MLKNITFFRSSSLGPSQPSRISLWEAKGLAGDLVPPTLFLYTIRIYFLYGRLGISKCPMHAILLLEIRALVAVVASRSGCGKGGSFPSASLRSKFQTTSESRGKKNQILFVRWGKRASERASERERERER